MDIVADSAALYGNEAVAGVVNFVPYKSYDGFKVTPEQDSRGDYDEHGVQMLWGDIGDVDVVLAGRSARTAVSAGMNAPACEFWSDHFI